MAATLRLMQESEMPPALNAALTELVCAANPQERQLFTSTGRGWHGVKPVYCSFMELDGQPVAYVGVVDRTIRVAPPSAPPLFLRVAGVQNVSVHPAHRGHSYSLAALTLAMNHALMQNFDVGLLFCTPDLERLYSKNGWRTIPNPITRTDDDRDVPLPGHNIAMFLPLRVHDFPPGPVHLQGNDW